MDCPKCSKTLEDHILEGKLYHKCTDCEGIWFDKGELAQIMEEKDWFKIDYKHSESVTTPKESGLICPRDGEVLKTVEYEPATDIKIHVCPKCEGIWLNAGDIYNIHKARETQVDIIKDNLDEKLKVFELFLIKIGPFLPK
jgi:Zn-finger nucleic acid-binding protein